MGILNRDPFSKDSFPPQNLMAEKEDKDENLPEMTEFADEPIWLDDNSDKPNKDKEPAETESKPESEPESKPIETEKPVIESAKETLPFEEKIQAAASVAELIQIVGQEDQAVAQLIGNAEDFLQQNMKEIVFGVLADKREEVRNNLGQVVKMVAAGDLQLKLKELMKKEMAVYFEQNRPELAQSAISEARNLPELFFIIKQFKGISGRGEKNENKRYLPDEVMAMIKGAENNLQIDLNADNFLVQAIGEIENKVRILLVDWRIPEDSGIRDQAEKIFLNQIKEKQSKKEAEGQAESAMKRGWKKLTGWFSRR